MRAWGAILRIRRLRGSDGQGQDQRKTMDGCRAVAGSAGDCDGHVSGKLVRGARTWVAYSGDSRWQRGQLEYEDTRRGKKRGQQRPHYLGQ
jgi:hypothetical protein